MRKLTREDYNICDKITTRVMEMGLYPSNYRVTAMMDIQNAAKYFNMRLQEWLEAEKFDFAHDVLGIARAINRVAYPVDFSNDPLFLPRFAGKEME